MKSKIESPIFISKSLTLVDSIRISILKITMSVPVFRRIFTTRAYRLLFFFFVSITFNFFFALKAPLWILLLGPLIFGVPHLIASVRYVPRLADISPHILTQKLYLTLGSAFILMATLRIWAMSHEAGAVNRYPNGLELLGSLLTVALIGYFSRRDKRRIFYATGVLASLFYMSFKFPIETIGSLVLLHNFVGFYYWITRAGTRRDRFSALLALGVFSGVTLLFLLGGLDSLMSGTSGILDGSLNDISIGTLIFPKSGFSMWGRAVSAYAFGQGVHYFVWLKAIPEQELSFEHPVSFTRSAKLLTADMGGKFAYAGGMVAIGLFVFAASASFPEARLLYLSGAAFHGYFEFAGLAFVRTRSL